jgi:hypothetical protein
MTCKRCDDIHQSQKEGKTQNACKCDCHDCYGATLTNPFWINATGTSATTDGTLTFNTDFNSTTDCGSKFENILRCEDIHYPPKCSEIHRDYSQE